MSKTESLLSPENENHSVETLLSSPIDEFMAELKTSPQGLSEDEAQRRLSIYGFNELAKKKKHLVIVEYLLSFKNPLAIMLILAGTISAIVGEMTNASLIFIIVVISSLLDFYQEYKAEKAAEMLKEKVATTTAVIRNGSKHDVKLAEIVPGDVVLLSAGSLIPADARVIKTNDLSVDQSALTGESFPVTKTAEPYEKKAGDITEWSNCLFMGTSVVSGSATAVIVKTGSGTEYGQIAQKLTARPPEKEFEKGLRKFGMLISQVALILVVFVFIIIALFKHDLLEALLFSVALAIGLIPELLPMMLSVNLSRGALAMSKKGVIVKKLACIQDFGSMDTLCTDKTGTLTENKIVMRQHLDVEGKNSEQVLLYCGLNSYFETGLKNPMDEAILEHEQLDLTGYVKAGEMPFDFVRKRLSVVVEHNAEHIMVTKGAPEEVFKVCNSYELHGEILELTADAMKQLNKKYDELSSEGFRVLGVSYLLIDKPKQNYSVSDETMMVFVGFATFIDPPKESSKDSVKLLQKAGVELKILTGDNELVTRYICKQLDLQIKGVASGAEIQQIDDDALAKLVEKTNIFVRLSPAQKNRVINVLRKNKHVVGYMGDGINDAPSMKAADVGISVNNAVDVAKESADIILLKQSLGVLYDGVLEGRKVFGNTMKYVMMGTSSSFGNMFSVAGGCIFLPFLPMLPIQILLNNLIYEFSQAATPTDNVDEEYLERPRRWDIGFVKKFMITFGPISSIFDFATYFLMLFVLNASASLFQTAWFIESLCTQTLVIFLIRTRRVPFYKSKPGKILLASSLTAVAVAIIIASTPIGDVFGFVRPPAIFYLVLIGFIGIYLLLVEAVKKLFYQRYANNTL
jgi:P-type Mg2+ transporter